MSTVAAPPPLPATGQDLVQSAFSALHADHAGWETLVVELFAEVERLLADLQQVELQLESEHNSLVAAQEELERQTTAAQSGEALSQSLHGQIRDHAEQRDRLQAELAQERRRSADLETQLTARGHDLAHEREQMKAELQRVKQLLQARSSVGGAQSGVMTNMPSTPVAGVNRDPLLGSVMAQFQQLQRQAQQRTPAT